MEKLLHILKKLVKKAIDPRYILFIYFVLNYNIGQALELKGNFIQGGLVIGNTESTAKVYLNNVNIPVDNEGEFLLAFSRKNKPLVKLEIILANGKKIKKNFNIKIRKYNIQKINNLDKKKVVPPSKFYDRIKKEIKLVKKAKKIKIATPFYKSGFIWPATGIITGVYGSQRILNGIPKRPHFGVDLANKIGTPIISPADGIVILANNDLYFSGGTVIISHGKGLSSSLLHLSDIFVIEGQKISKGEIVGAMGQTGRATGVHLDWRMELRGVRIDPQLLVKDKEVKKKI